MCNAMFPNQVLFGKHIAKAFENNNVRSILAVAMTQSGKTGSMLSVMEHVPHEHAFLITGLSSVEWVEQTKLRFPPHFQNSIFHRNQLPTFVKKVKNLHNVLIIIDENQVAFQPGQTIHKSFVEAQLMDPNDLVQKNVRIVHFTATPPNTDDFIRSDNMDVVLMNPDSSYVSAFQLLEQGRILEYKDICGIDSQLMEIKESIKKFTRLIKKHEELKKTHLAIVKKAHSDIKKHTSVLNKATRELHRAQSRIDKTQDFLKRSEHMLNKLVLDNDFESSQSIIRDCQDVIQHSTSIVQDSEVVIRESKTLLLDSQERLKRSNAILLKPDYEISDEEHLFLVGGPKSLVFKNIDQIRTYIGSVPKYHIIRTSHSFHHSITIRNFKLRFHNSDFLSDMDMDSLLNVKPDKHTFLFIKEKLRCAKTLVKDHLGVLYERITDNPNMDTILQGLVGRLTGYHNNRNAVVFSNPDLVRLYHQLWLNQFKQAISKKNTILLGTRF
jgi:hypothetical protein